LSGFDGANVGRLRETTLFDFDSTSDHVLQFDAEGYRLEVRVWKAGERMPPIPTLAIGDLRTLGLNRNFGGSASIAYTAYRGHPAGAYGVFRCFQVSEEKITNETSCCPASDPSPHFIRGDANADGGSPDLADAVFVLSFLFTGGEEPSCEDSADADDSETLEITDAIYLLSYLFLGGPPPPPPYPDCGEDPVGDDLTCEEYPPCQGG
jgi:hypothetical protein